MRALGYAAALKVCHLDLSGPRPRSDESMAKAAFIGICRSEPGGVTSPSRFRVAAPTSGRVFMSDGADRGERPVACRPVVCVVGDMCLLGGLTASGEGRSVGVQGPGARALMEVSWTPSASFERVGAAFSQPWTGATDSGNPQLDP